MKQLQITKVGFDLTQEHKNGFETLYLKIAKVKSKKHIQN
jgi:hypothetical protein